MFGTDLRSIGGRAKAALTAKGTGLVSAVATAGLLAGCGGAGVQVADRTHGEASDPAHGGQPFGGPRVGTTQRIDVAGAHLSVTVVKVVDLPRDDDAPVLPGFRGVGVKVEISNTGPADYDSLATSDFSITATDPNVHLLFVPSGLCRTPPRDFDSHITVGETHSGCLAFRIHERARVTEVTFSPHGKPAGQLSWGR
jgi:hypothetical protein